MCFRTRQQIPYSFPNASDFGCLIKQTEGTPQKLCFANDG